MRIAIVGVCGSGKSELARRLAERGLDAASVAQEHSHVPALWRHEAEPDLLVYLVASPAVVRRRGKAMAESEFAAQEQRLADARYHAHLVVETDSLTADQVERALLTYLRANSGASAVHPHRNLGEGGGVNGYTRLKENVK